MKEMGAEHHSLKGFFGLVPRQPELEAHLHDNLKISTNSLASLWSKVCQHAVDLLLKLGETMAKTKQAKEAQGRLLC